MSRGYLIPVGDYDATEALVNSIKVTQDDPQIAIMVPARTKVPPLVKDAVDHIVRIPKDILDEKTWYNNECNVALSYDLSPFDETIVLADNMIVPVDISYMWELLTPYDMLFATNPLTYRGNTIYSDPTRTGFVQNRLSNIYTSMTYFKKSDTARDVFDMAVGLADHWKEYRKMRLQGDIGYHPTNDPLFACAIKEAGYVRETYRSDTKWFSIVDMVLKATDVENAADLDPDWLSQINSYVKSDGSLIVGQYLQHLPFRYHLKGFLRPSVTDLLRSSAK